MSRTVPELVQPTQSSESDQLYWNSWPQQIYIIGHGGRISSQISTFLIY